MKSKIINGILLSALTIGLLTGCSDTEKNNDINIIQKMTMKPKSEVLDLYKRLTYQKIQRDKVLSKAEIIRLLKETDIEDKGAFYKVLMMDNQYGIDIFDIIIEKMEEKINNKKLVNIDMFVESKFFKQMDAKNVKRLLDNDGIYDSRKEPMLLNPNLTNEDLLDFLSKDKNKSFITTKLLSRENLPKSIIEKIINDESNLEAITKNQLSKTSYFIFANAQAFEMLKNGQLDSEQYTKRERMMMSDIAKNSFILDDANDIFNTPRYKKNTKEIVYLVKNYREKYLQDLVDIGNKKMIDNLTKEQESLWNLDKNYDWKRDYKKKIEEESN